MRRVLTIRTLGIALVVVLTVLILSVVATNVVAVHCFPDVPDANFAHNFICDIFDLGIVSGFPDGTYRLNNGVTRAEMAVFVRNTTNLIPRAVFFNQEENIQLTAGDEAGANVIATLPITNARHCLLLMNGTVAWDSDPGPGLGRLELFWAVNGSGVGVGTPAVTHAFEGVKHAGVSEDESTTAITSTVVPPGNHIVTLRAYGNPLPIEIGTLGASVLCVPLDEAGNVPTQAAAPSAAPEGFVEAVQD